MDDIRRGQNPSIGRNLAIFIAIAALVSVFAFIVISPVDVDSSYPDHGDAGGGVTWKWDPETRTLTFSKTGSGDGRIDDQPDYYLPLWGHAFEDASYVVVEQGVTYLGKRTFAANIDPSIELLTVPVDLDYGTFSAFSMRGLKAIKLTGNGPMAAYDSGKWELPWYRSDHLETIIVDYGVTSISDKVFEKCRTIQQVDLPATLKKIGADAFSGCRWLSKITLPAQLEWIGDSAFFECGLRSVTVPDTVTHMGDGVFMNNSKLTFAKLSNSIDYVPDDTFLYCYDLATVATPVIKTIGKNAFSNCRALEKFDFKEGLISIGNSAFSSTGLKSLELPSTLKVIDSSAFGAIAALKSVYIPSTVESVGSAAFGMCVYLEKVEIGDGVKLCDGAFAWSISIQYVKFGQNVTIESARTFDYIKFYMDGSELSFNQLAGHTFEGKDCRLVAVD
ncbi:MAG: leucine-rich repeat protein [Candidatus Methanomethylophilaceae archaeon]|nr:leucine-rich repeat protein [Candidatus Methanomethylophilaceae archaeon]